MPINMKFDDLDLREEPARLTDGKMYAGDTTLVSPSHGCSRIPCTDTCSDYCCTANC